MGPRRNELPGVAGPRLRLTGWSVLRPHLLEERDAAPAGEPEPPCFSVIVVNYNAGALLTTCVLSVLRSTAPLELFVIDNASTDGSMRTLKERVQGDSRLKIIENPQNLGFARANNIVLPDTCGRYMLLLNPDCLIEPDTLDRMAAILDESPEAGLAGCLVRNLDGTEQAGCRRAVPTPWRSAVRILHLDRLFPNHPRFRSFVLVNEPLPAGPAAVEAISGAFMVARRSALDSVGLLDEGYFLHCEDLDWCMRFREAGWEILFVPQIEVVHAKGVSSYSTPVRVLWHKHRGMVRFYRKFFRRRYSPFLMGAVVAAVWVRFTALAIATFVGRGKS